MKLKRGKAVVTGAAGFVGSHLAERLLALDYTVVGVDCFTDYYPRQMKEANLASLLRHPCFQLITSDILDLSCTMLLDGADYLFHQAAQAGVRGSWGNSFADYVRHNIMATQRLLEAASERRNLRGMIFASSSSVYGDAEAFPTPESLTPRPVSPYGITKLACEHLCRVYHESFDVPVVVLRYFTAYGPRQRPDMAFRRFMDALLNGKELIVYGDGQQSRDFTYVSDVVEANILAMNPAANGGTFNVGGGSRITLLEVLEVMESLTHTRAKVRFGTSQKGDARHTSADISNARNILGYKPSVGIEEGLREELAWFIQGSSTTLVPILEGAFSDGSLLNADQEGFVPSM